MLIAQPLIASTCKVEEQCYSDKCCKKKGYNDKNSKEESKECNPCMNCPFCNLFIVTKSAISLDVIIPGKEKPFAKNDNRIIQNQSGCWHPPRYENLITECIL